MFCLTSRLNCQLLRRRASCRACRAPLSSASSKSPHPAAAKLGCHPQRPPAAETLRRFLVDRIKTHGPITVAEFMSTVLNAPDAGYYARARAGKPFKSTNLDDGNLDFSSSQILGSKGDFATSPELTQLMGEFLAVWVVGAVYNVLLHRDAWSLTELGPGSGELMSDVLQSFGQFRADPEFVSVNLFEISKFLALQQAEKLLRNADLPPVNSSQDWPPHDRTFTGKAGYPITWCSKFSTLPPRPCVFLAHEFFDALPIHQFRLTDDGWREVLVCHEAISGARDDNKTAMSAKTGDDDSSNEFSFVLAPRDSMAQNAYLTPAVLDAAEASGQTELEISPRSVAILEELCGHINRHGGAVLIVDYGHTGDKGDTFRGFRQHALCDPLTHIGDADLTADVNFAYLRQHCEKHAAVLGPIPQADFLTNLGIAVRYEVLMQNTRDRAKRAYLQRCFDVLMSEREMGLRFKVMALFPKGLDQYFDQGLLVPGFSLLPGS